MPATALLEAELTAAAPLDRCRHCGDVNDGGAVTNAFGRFCCTGCATVFEILDAHGLCEVGPSRDPFGVSQRDASRRDPERFAVLDDPAVAARFIDFDDGVRTHVTLTIPSIHCASCVWVLEQLWRFEPGVARSEVDLMRRSIHIEFQAPATSLRAIAERLAALGYEPQTGPERAAVGMPASRQRLYLQLGVAGFAFGNIMIFSLPRYLNGGQTPGQVIAQRPDLKPLWYDQPDHQYGRPARYYQQVQALDVAGAWAEVKVPVLLLRAQ